MILLSPRVHDPNINQLRMQNTKDVGPDKMDHLIMGHMSSGMFEEK